MMKLRKLLESLSSPLGICLIVAALVATTVLGVTLSAYLAPKKQVRITYRDNETGKLLSPAERLVVADLFATQSTIHSGNRLKEAIGLTLAVSVFCTQKSAFESLPSNADQLLVGMTAARMLPDGMSYMPAPTPFVKTNTGRCFLRYRPAPFGLEVISIADEENRGVPLFIRFPASNLIPDSPVRNPSPIELYGYTGKQKPLSIPPPFVSHFELGLAGWKYQPIDDQELPSTELESLEKWIRETNPTHYLK